MKIPPKVLQRPEGPTVTKQVRRILNSEHHAYGKQVRVAELVVRVVALAQTLKEKQFYPYQVELASRIVESLLMHDSETVTALMSRQSGKTETLGAIVAAILIIFPPLAKQFPDDWHLNITDDKGVYRGFAFGVKVGIYAPRLDQAGIMYDRVRQALDSDTAKKVLRELNITQEVSNGNTVRLSNGSRVLCESASEQSKIEGETHNLLVCLAGDSQVEFADGTFKTIKEVVEQRLQGEVRTVLNGVETFRPITSWSNRGRKNTLVLKTETGKQVRCTPDHLVFTHQLGWVEAENTLGLTVDFACRSPLNIRDDDTTHKRLSDRNPARGREHSLSVQRLDERPLYDLAGMAAARLRVPQGGSVEGLPTPPGEENSKQRERLFPCPSFDAVLSAVYRMAGTVLPERREVSSGEHSGTANSPRNRLLVYGRRLPVVGHISDLSYRGIFISRLGQVAEGFSALPSYRADCSAGPLPSFEDSLSFPFSSHAVSSAVCSAFDGLQAKASSFVKAKVFRLRAKLHRLSNRKEKPGTTCLLSEVPTGAKSALSSAARHEKKESSLRPCSTGEVVVEVLKSSLEDVYDIGVAETHCFFANGLLVHNCEEAQDISDLKMKKSLHPMVSATGGTIVKVGTATTQKCDFYTAIKQNERTQLITGKRNHFFFPYTVTQQYNSLYRANIEQEKIRLGEDSDEFRTSYAAEWIFERGMFITSEQLFDTRCATAEGVFSATHPNGLPKILPQYSIVVGIDWGSSSDSTVLTSLAVDWMNPVESGETSNARGIFHYEYYMKSVTDWVEYIGDNYEVQFANVVAYLRGIRGLKKVVTDSNGCGKPLYDRLVAVMAHTGVEVQEFNFQPRLKSDGFKSLYSDICGGRLTFPAGSAVRKTPQFRRFIAQMLDMRKTYKNQLMQVAHPVERDAHDDYGCSLMLAAFGANTAVNSTTIDYLENNLFYK